MSEKKGTVLNLAASGVAGCTEALVMMPLDTLKTRAQLDARYNNPLRGVRHMIAEEGAWSLYKGLPALLAGITPKVVVRFAAFEMMKRLLGDEEGRLTNTERFFAGLGAGAIEAVVVVTPFEMVKVRMQDDARGGGTRKYRGFPNAVTTIVKTEGPTALYKGIGATTYRQATSAAMRFMFFDIFRRQLEALQGEEKSWHAFVAGAGGGAVSAVVNNPVDVLKTRLQRQETVPGTEPKYRNAIQCARVIYHEEGISAFMRGVVPRLARIVPGQAVVFGAHTGVYNMLVSTFGKF